MQKDMRDMDDESMKALANDILAKCQEQVFDFTKKKLEDYMAKKSVETTTVAHFGNVGEDNKNRKE